MKHDETKLPKWVQEKLMMLRADVARANKTIKELTKPAENARITYRAGYWEEKALPDDTQISFKLGNGMEVNVLLHNDEVRIYGSGSIAIEPKTDNSVYVTGRK